MASALFFDNASTTRCSPAAWEALHRYTVEEFGNPSSSHALGERASRAIRAARHFFADYFRVEGDQIVFTSGGTEADNLAILGPAFRLLSRAEGRKALASAHPPRILVSATEHPAVLKTALSLRDFGFDVRSIPVDAAGQIRGDAYEALLTPETRLVSIHAVNNISGSLLPVEALARIAKVKNPGCLFHTDAVQACGKTPLPRASSPIDLLSLSAHKIHGPKGVGALILLNRRILETSALRPALFGGGQEHGLRAGTQSAALIAGFHEAARDSLAKLPENRRRVQELQTLFQTLLLQRGLVSPLLSGALPADVLRAEYPYRWNSPPVSEGLAVPHIVSLSAVGLPTAPLVRMIEDAGVIVSTGSACSSSRPEPDSVLTEMGLPETLASSAIRVSFSSLQADPEVHALVAVLENCARNLRTLLGPKRPDDRDRSRERGARP